MLTRLLDVFKQNFEITIDLSEKDRNHNIQLATTVLLLELMSADGELDESEWISLQETLIDTFDIDKSEIQSLIETSQDVLADSTDYYQFTKLINDMYDYEDKLTLLTGLWRLAYADGRIDKFEEHLIRKITGLIHVSHADFIKTKQLGRG